MGKRRKCGREQRNRYKLSGAESRSGAKRAFREQRWHYINRFQRDGVVVDIGQLVLGERTFGDRSIAIEHIRKKLQDQAKLHN